MANEVIWLKKISNFMHGLKSAISASFQKLADWLDWPCPVKGQLISKCPLAFIVWTKIPPKNLTNSALEWVGQNLSNFSVVFWSKR